MTLLTRFAAYCGLVVAGLFHVPAGAQQLSLRYYTTTEGLGNLAVTALAQEPSGALWIGTENGLFRHDGESIRRLDGGLESEILGVVFDTAGTPWFSSLAGLYRHTDGRFVLVPALGGRWSTRKGQVLAALPEGGVLAVGDEGGLWRAKGKQERMEPALPPVLGDLPTRLLDVQSILVAHDGAWWFGCGGAVCRWRQNRLQRWGVTEGVPQEPWIGLLEARDGSIWARSRRHVVRRVGESARFLDATPPGAGRGTNSTQLPLHEDAAGRILTAGDSGVFRWERGQWRHLGPRNGLREDGLRNMLFDGQGGLWLGTTGHGLLHWRDYDHWSSWTTHQGLPSDVVWSVADDRAGRVWVGTSRGAVSVERAGTQLSNEAPEITGQVGAMVADGQGGMWLSTFSGELFHRARGASWRLVVNHNKFAGWRLWAVGDELWVQGNEQGLFSTPLDGSGPFRWRDDLDSRMNGNDHSVYTVCRDARSGVAWVGTMDGLFRYDPDQGFARAQVQGLEPELGVSYLACGADRLWLRTALGRKLMRIDLTSHAPLRAEWLQPVVLKGLRLLSLLEDSRGWLWAGTDGGLVLWNGKGWRRFDESNGLAWNDCDQGALSEDDQGAIWIGTSRGVSRIARPERLGTTAPLVLKVTEARQGARQLAVGQRTELPWSTQPLELRWEVPLFSNRQAQRTRYRLLGYDDTWTDLSRNELRYAGLGPGSYSLELQAINDDLGHSSQPVVLDFEIAPPWWRRWPVIVVALGLAALLVYAGYRVRIRRLVRHQAELKALVEERTRELAESHERMRKLAFTDSLTGALSRRAIFDLASRELAQMRRSGGALTVVLLDLDYFKRVNDNHGHPAGDALLRALVQRLQTQIRDGDCLGRYGGEEFLLVLPGLSLDDPSAFERIDKWRRAVAEQPFDVGAIQTLHVTCSMGVASASMTDTTVNTLIARADAALYRAKNTGRDRVVMQD